MENTMEPNYCFWCGDYSRENSCDECSTLFDLIKSKPHVVTEMMHRIYGIVVYDKKNIEAVMLKQIFRTADE